MSVCLVWFRWLLSSFFLLGLLLLLVLKFNADAPEWLSMILCLFVFFLRSDIDLDLIMRVQIPDCSIVVLFETKRIQSDVSTVTLCKRRLPTYLSLILGS